MSGDIFLKIDEAKGESVKDGHKDEIELESFSWGGSNPTSFVHGGGGGVGKVELQDVHCTKPIDKASPKLFNFCCTGTHLKTAVFTCRKAGDKPQDFLKIKLTDVMVAAFTLADSGGGSLPQESISFSYAKLEGGYSPQKSDGTLDAEIKFGWNVKEHKPAP